MAQGDHRGSVTASVNSVTNPTVLSGSVANVAVGDLIFGVFAQQTALTATTTVTDNLGNTYSYVNAGTDAGNATIRCFYARVTTGGTLTTVNVPATASTNDASAIASVIEGPFVTSPLDANPANATDGTSPHACPATGTLAQNHEVVMAACALASNISMTATSPGSLTQAVARANVSCAVSKTVVTATTTVTPEFGNGATANAGQTTASFKLRYQPLDAGAGSYSATGTDAALEHDKIASADGGSYAIIGSDATLAKGQTLAADAGSYAISGTDAALEHDWTLAADAGSYAISGTDAATLHDWRFDADSGSYAVSGTDATLEISGDPNKTLDADAGSYAVSGTDAALAQARFVAADGGSYAVSGTAAALLHDSVVVAEGGSYAVSGADAALDKGLRLDADAGSYAVSGTNAGLISDRVLAADGGTISLSGATVSLGLGRFLDAESGSIVLAGTDASLQAGRVVAAGGGSYLINGAPASLDYLPILTDPGEVFVDVAVRSAQNANVAVRSAQNANVSVRRPIVTTAIKSTQGIRE